MLISRQIDAEAREALIRRILDWPGLRRAEKLARLLTCLHEHLSSPALTEKELGTLLFPRRPGHDYSEDSIVRVSVRQLRFKLQEYFAGPGAQEPWVVEIPRGEYRLCFVERTFDVPVPEQETVPDPVGNRLRIGVAVVIAALLGALAGFWLGHARGTVAQDTPENLLTLAMSGGKYSLTVVPGDASHRVVTTLSNPDETLAEYLAGSSPPNREVAGEDAAGRLYRWLVGTRLVSSAHSAAAATLVASVGELRSRAVVRHPRELTVRNLQQNSFVFLAARYMNPFVDLFEERLTLRCDNDAPARRIGIVDTLASDRHRYVSEETRDVASFARVALLPNLGADGGRVLLLSGLGPVGTEAAALVAADPQWLRAIRARLPEGQVFFEALVEAKSLNALPVDVKIRIVRPLNPTK